MLIDRRQVNESQMPANGETERKRATGRESMLLRPAARQLMPPFSPSVCTFSFSFSLFPYDCRVLRLCLKSVQDMDYHII